MKAKDIEGKLLKVNRGTTSLFLTVKRVVDISSDYVLFEDKFHKEQYCRFKDIEEIF